MTESSATRKPSESGVPNPASYHPAQKDGGRAPGWYARVLRRLRFHAHDSVRDDLEDVLARTVENVNFSPQERAMLRNVLSFHRIRVDDVMVPRADIVAVADDIALGDLLRVFRTAGHSRLPVYGETLDDPKGMIHIRDLLNFIVERAETRSGSEEDQPAGPLLGEVDLSLPLIGAQILRPVIFAPPSMPAVDLLVRMQANRTHIALVIDEYGGTDGLVSIEDLIETVVGDIEDEHDDAAVRMVAPGSNGAFIADARASLEEVSEAVGIDLTGGDLAEDIDTLGGLIVTLAGRVPSRGELIAAPEGVEFEVLDADPRRLKRVRIHKRESGLVKRDRASHKTESNAAPDDSALKPERVASDSVFPSSSSGAG